MKIILMLIMAATSTMASADPVKFAECQYGVMIAQQAYLSGTFDTKYPDLDHLDYLVDYWADDLGYVLDRKVARRAVRSVAKDLTKQTIRRPSEGLLYEPVRKALITECFKYMDQ